MEKYTGSFNDIKVTLVKTDKFKTITIKVAFLNDFTKDNATKYSLLSRVLSNTTKQYNTKKKILDKLFSMYDTSFDISSYPIYKTRITSFTIDVVNQKYVSDDNLLAQAVAFLNELILSPNASDAKFDQAVFEEEKRNLLHALKRVYNNKSRYAVRRAIENMTGDDILKVSASGTIEQLEKLTNEQLYATYIDMIENSKILIYAIGDFECDYMFNTLKSLNLTSAKRPLDCVCDLTFENLNASEHQEYQSLNQSKLVMIYRTKVNAKDSLYYAQCLFNEMFGGLLSSDLFRIIREERSLAYSIGSQIVADNKVMFVTAGIDGKDYNVVTSLVNKQLELYKQGKIDEELLATAKENLISEFNEINDLPHSYCGFLLKMDVIKNENDILDMVDIVSNVKSEDIKEVANGIVLDTIFLLTDKEAV